MKGNRNMPVFQALQGALSVDLDRTLQVLNALDAMSCKWDRFNWFRNLGMRIKYGVEADLVELCQAPNIGAVRAKKLKENNINSLDQLVNFDVKTLSKILKCSVKIAQETLDGAKEIHLKESIS